MSNEQLRIEDVAIGKEVVCLFKEGTNRTGKIKDIRIIVDVDGRNADMSLSRLSPVTDASDLRRHVPAEEPAPKREWKVGDKCGEKRSCSYKSVGLAKGNILAINSIEPRFLVEGEWSNGVTTRLWVFTDDLCEPEPEPTTVAKGSEAQATTDPVKAIADKTVLTFRDKLIIAALGGQWASSDEMRDSFDLLESVDRMIAEMAKVKP